MSLPEMKQPRYKTSSSSYLQPSQILCSELLMAALFSTLVVEKWWWWLAGRLALMTMVMLIAEDENDNGEDNDNDDYNERCIVTCLLQASQVLLFLITNRLVVKCFPQWSTSAWQRTITGRPCPLSRFQGSPNRLCKKTRFRRFRWKIVFVDCADDNDDCNVV